MAAKFSGGTGALGGGGDLLEQPVHHSGGLGGDDPGGGEVLLQHHFAVAVQHLSVGVGRGEGAAVAEDLVSAGHLQGSDAHTEGT